MSALARSPWTSARSGATATSGRCIAAQFVSFLGSMVTYVALPYQMFKLTGSSLAVGLLGLAELLPLLVTAFVGGALADTVDRRRMVLVDRGRASALGSGALALTALARQPPVWIALRDRRASCRRSTACSGPRSTRSRRGSWTATRSRPRRLWRCFRGSVGMIAGPALGGALIAVDRPRRHLRSSTSLTYVFSFFAIRTIRAVLAAGVARSARACAACSKASATRAAARS